MFQLLVTLGDEDDLTRPYLTLYRFRADTSSGVVVANARYEAGGPTYSAQLARPAAGVHLYYIKQTEAAVLLGIDDDEDTAVGPSLPPGGADTVSVADDAAGTYYEVFVTTDQLTAAEETALKAYFRRRYPGLPT